MRLLAQTDVTVTIPPEPTYVFQPEAWIPSTAELMRGGLVSLALVAGAMVLWALLRRPLVRFKLTAAFAAAVVALVVYFTISALKPGRMLDETDLVRLWINRTFVAALVFAGLRALDRLVFVPVLTRGGKVPIQRFVQQICNTIAIIFAVLGYGSWAFGWDIDKLLAGSAVVSIVLGLALQETLGNFFSGMVMQASSPFSFGDWIVVGGVEGRVVDMTWRAVTIHTADDNYVLIPNATVAKELITNFHAPSIATARTVRVGLEYEIAPNDAIAVLTQGALDTPGVLPEPPPFVYLEDYADSAIVYRVKFWINDPARHLRIEHGVRLNIWYRLKQRGFNIPFQIQTVEFVDLMKKLDREREIGANERCRTLSGVELFRALSPQQRQKLATDASELQLAAGQVLFQQDDPGDRFYIVRRGKVDVLVRPPHGGDQLKVATLGEGEFFGEMSALTGQPRTATIRAVADVTLIEIDKGDLTNLFESDPSIMEKLSEVIARRNADREAAMQGSVTSGSAPAEIVVAKKRSLLDRMTTFFGIGTPARA